MGGSMPWGNSPHPLPPVVPEGGQAGRRGETQDSATTGTPLLFGENSESAAMARAKAGCSTEQPALMDPPQGLVACRRT